jgi:hypothetical protein
MNFQVTDASNIHNSLQDKSVIRRDEFSSYGLNSTKTIQILFRKDTQITMEIPNKVITGVLHIYDMSGKLLEKHLITDPSLTSRLQLSAGIYLYALIADITASKRKKNDPCQLKIILHTI